MKKVSAADIKKRVDRIVEMTSLQEFVSRKPRTAFGRPASAGRSGASHRLRAESAPARRASQRP